MRLKFWKRREELAKTPWGRYGISDEQVAAYLNKNDEYELNVPLQIAQRMLDEVANELVRQPTADALSLARAQGQMMGIAKVALELAKTARAAEAWKSAGGVR